MEAEDTLPNLPIAGLTADSRDVRSGYLFAAIPGTSADGADFISDALDKGAIAILAPPSVSSVSVGARATLITDSNPRRRLARMAARFYGDQPNDIVAVTGTNGKSSVASFTRQLWRLGGSAAASIGTLGIEGPGYDGGPGLTSPDPVSLHATLREMSGRGIDRVAIEASSHGLDQFRLDGVKFSAAAFTNLTRDHLDYHGDFESYRAAKFRLFEDLVPSGAVAVLNAESGEFDRLNSICKDRGLTVHSYGIERGDIHCLKAEASDDGFALSMSVFGRTLNADLPLPGRFQLENALAALGLFVATGGQAETASENFSRLVGVRGRLHMAARLGSGARVYVDYAHTPDALEAVLRSVRPHVAGRLVVIFGCGGDRDPGKRPMMGRVVQELADTAIVTDDNPRSEEPAKIRAAALAACPDAQDIGDRKQAIWEGMRGLKGGDVLIVAGKGHEPGQIVGDEVLPFDDIEEVASAAAALESGAKT